MPFEDFSSPNIPKDVLSFKPLKPISEITYSLIKIKISWSSDSVVPQNARKKCTSRYVILPFLVNFEKFARKNALYVKYLTKKSIYILHTCFAGYHAIITACFACIGSKLCFSMRMHLYNRI